MPLHASQLEHLAPTACTQHVALSLRLTQPSNSHPPLPHHIDQAARKLYPDTGSPAAPGAGAGSSQPAAMAAAMAGACSASGSASRTYEQTIAEKMQAENKRYHELVDGITGPDKNVRLEVGDQIC